MDGSFRQIEDLGERLTGERERIKLSGRMVSVPHKAPKLKTEFVCLECGKIMSERAAYANRCPKCGGSDIEVR